MFGNNEKIKELQKRIKSLEEDLKSARNGEDWSDKRVKKVESEKDDLIKLHDSENRIKDSELKMRIDEALMEKTKENNELKMENGCQKREVEILKKAFENLGFDVKDMKGILNKLVDGIVSKNQIQLVK